MTAKTTKYKFVPDGCTGKGEEKDCFFKMYIDGPQGAKFEIFKDKHNTNEDIQKAKKWLYKNHDVVSVSIVSHLQYDVYER